MQAPVGVGEDDAGFDGAGVVGGVLDEEVHDVDDVVAGPQRVGEGDEHVGKLPSRSVADMTPV